eukprot:3246910-Pleurochrysis_carterae.AAC.1
MQVRRRRQAFRPRRFSLARAASRRARRSLATHTRTPFLPADRPPDQSINQASKQWLSLSLSNLSLVC